MEQEPLRCHQLAVAKRNPLVTSKTPTKSASRDSKPVSGPPERQQSKTKTARPSAGLTLRHATSTEGREEKRQLRLIVGRAIIPLLYLAQGIELANVLRSGATAAA